MLYIVCVLLLLLLCAVYLFVLGYVVSCCFSFLLKLFAVCCPLFVVCCSPLCLSSVVCFIKMFLALVPMLVQFHLRLLHDGVAATTSAPAAAVFASHARGRAHVHA